MKVGDQVQPWYYSYVVESLGPTTVKNYIDITVGMTSMLLGPTIVILSIYYCRYDFYILETYYCWYPYYCQALYISTVGMFPI